MDGGPSPVAEAARAEPGIARLPAGVDQATISRIERGLATPRPETVVRVARALRIGAKRMAEIMAASQEFDEYAAKEAAAYSAEEVAS